MEIFIKYQIPSDLISYTENEEREDTKYVVNFFFMIIIPFLLFSSKF